MGKLTIKAKTDIGKLHALFNVSLDGGDYTIGQAGSNGYIHNSAGFVAMKIGDQFAGTCNGADFYDTCVAQDGYYEFSINIPKNVDADVNVNNSELFYDVSKTVTVDDDGNPIFVFDFSRKTSTLDITSELTGVQNPRDVINHVTINLVDSQNINDICASAVGDFCRA